MKMIIIQHKSFALMIIVLSQCNLYHIHGIYSQSGEHVLCLTSSKLWHINLIRCVRQPNMISNVWNNSRVTREMPLHDVIKWKHLPRCWTFVRESVIQKWEFIIVVTFFNYSYWCIYHITLFHFMQWHPNDSNLKYCIKQDDTGNVDVWSDFKPKHLSLLLQ